METTEKFTDYIREEISRAVRGPVDDFVDSLPVGTFLLPFPIALGLVGLASYELWTNVAGNLARVPALVVGRYIVGILAKADSTKVVRLDEAKLFAASQCLGAVYDLSGANPPNSIRKYLKFSKQFKGIKKRFIAVEQQQILGKVLQKFFSVLRAPARAVLLALELFWKVVVALCAIGALFPLYAVLTADWESVALSQKHPRKRLNVRINRRL